MLQTLRQHSLRASHSTALIAPLTSITAQNFPRSTQTPSASFSSSVARSHRTPASSLLSLAPTLRLLPHRHASITTTPTTSSQFESELTDLMDCLQILLESPRFEKENLDVNLADGVLSVVSPAHGTWVLNKHTPTRQIWLSSPVSGPRKYNFHAEHSSPAATTAAAGGTAGSGVGDGWRGERDVEEQLKRRLIDEWSRCFSVQIDAVKDFQSQHHE
jgi:frataxin-like iron-binding protein CyaY